MCDSFLFTSKVEPFISLRDLFHLLALDQEIPFNFLRIQIQFKPQKNRIHTLNIFFKKTFAPRPSSNLTGISVGTASSDNTLLTIQRFVLSPCNSDEAHKSTSAHVCLFQTWPTIGLVAAWAAFKFQPLSVSVFSRITDSPLFVGT